jgi:phosphatidate cytidylyltransferase
MFLWWMTRLERNKTNLKNLIVRTITGAIFAASIIASAIYSPIAFSLLFLVMALLGFREFQRLNIKDLDFGKVLPGMIAGFVIYALLSLFALSYIDAYLLWMIIPVITLLASVHVLMYKHESLKYISLDVSGIIFVIIPLALLNLYLNPTVIPGYHTPWLVLGMFIILWTHDTFAYLTGSMFGKHPLSESISPKKSWEGSIGGFGFAIISAYIISIFSPWLDMWHWMAIACIIAVFGTIGDLAESLLKRRAGVKDSGTILPGHGGILDRFDSVLFVSPIIFLLILFFIS